MATDITGEVEIDLDGKTWTLRPELQTLRAIERKTGKSASVLARAIGLGEATLDQMITVIELGLKPANDDPPGFDQIGEALLRHGVKGLILALLAFLGVVAVGDDAKKLLALQGSEPAAETEPATTPATDTPPPGGA